MIEQQTNLKDINQYSGLSLAYIGDCVYELMVRERILSQGNMPVNKLHKKSVSIVCASAQSKAYELVKDLLTEQETAVYKRGRNANGNHVPKNANPQDYRRATGLEALFGYLYLTNQTNRVLELFEIIFSGLQTESI
ncbi:ribonuclease III domain-containing protein [Paludicola sp. MB14-C6]|uniref:Mini-ribonuclease 3 n=1 Tax=Paludihabitans sp. MB14-C6 TaxID=3070656 RepID=UPI0027DAD570|nr:ribonuclease III domain-containing protein [Paludicola sp. MB14-C6]WMJ23066.1 ribonuclease III domain-containing protein [Paludicola sp. MB14-C6]